MRIRISLTKTVIILCSAILLFMAGCGKQSEQQDAQLQAAQEKQKQEKESEKLKNIETRIETLFEILGGPSVKMDEAGSKKEEDKQEQQGTQQQGTQNQGGQKQSGGQEQGGQQQEGTKQEGGKQQGGQQEQQGSQPKENQQKPPDKWTEVDTIISNLHYQWNEFMPELAKKGADMKLIDNFDNALNNLTTTTATKKTDKVLTSANALYAYVPDLYSQYRTKLSPESKRMVYYTRNIILESAKENWEQVTKDNDAIEKSWSLFRNTLEEEQQQTGDKLDFSIYELKKVVAEKNKQLADIKGRVVLNNIKELQKSFEDKN